MGSQFLKLGMQGISNYITVNIMTFIQEYNQSYCMMKFLKDLILLSKSTIQHKVHQGLMWWSITQLGSSHVGSVALLGFPNPSALATQWSIIQISSRPFGDPSIAQLDSGHMWSIALLRFPNPSALATRWYIAQVGFGHLAIRHPTWVPKSINFSHSIIHCSTQVWPHDDLSPHSDFQIHRLWPHDNQSPYLGFWTHQL